MRICMYVSHGDELFGGERKRERERSDLFIIHPRARPLFLFSRRRRRVSAFSPHNARERENSMKNIIPPTLEESWRAFMLTRGEKRARFSFIDKAKKFRFAWHA